MVLHRVGTDRAGPLDSIRTTATGNFAFRYRPSGDSTAIYFVSTSFGGVAYFTPPLRSAVVKGDDATITVFDTTSKPIDIKVGGRHLVVGAPNANGRRPVGEVYDLQNDTTVTVIAKDSASPVWTTHIPSQAIDFQLNTNGDLANGAIGRKGSSVGVFVPISPGIRQVAFTYDLPQNAFPLKIPVEGPIGVFEVLVQEPDAHVQGPQFRTMAPVSTEGRTFKRFLAQDLQAGALVQVDVPHVVGAAREKVYIGVSVALIGAMAAALMVTARRAMTRPRVAAVSRSEPQSEELLRSLAALDAEFERNPSPDQGTRAAYELRRRELKSALMKVLEAQRRR